MKYRPHDLLGLQGDNVKMVKIQLDGGKCTQNCEGTAGAKWELSSDSEVGSHGSPSSGWLCFFSPTENPVYSLSMCCSKCITRQQKSEKVPMVRDGFQNSHSCHQPKTALQIKKEKQGIWKKKFFFFDRVKSIKSVWPTSVALILHRLIYMLHLLYWVLTFTVIHKEKHMNQCLQGHSQLSTKCKF